MPFVLCVPFWETAHGFCAVWRNHFRPSLARTARKTRRTLFGVLSAGALGRHFILINNRMAHPMVCPSGRQSFEVSLTLGTSVSPARLVTSTRRSSKFRQGHFLAPGSYVIGAQLYENGNLASFPDNAQGVTSLPG